jgi:hypothetical protein
MDYRRSTAWELMGFRLRPAGDFVRSGHRFPRRAVEGMAQGLGLVERQQVGSGSTIPPQNLPDRRRGLIGPGAPFDCQSDQRLIDADGQWPNPAVVLSREHGGQVTQQVAQQFQRLQIRRSGG